MTEPIAQLVNPDALERLELMGPTVEFLVPPGDDGEPCVMRGTIPPGGVVPLHSHGDPETFLCLAGEVEGLIHSDAGYTWVPVRAGDVFHVPGHAKHAWRNLATEPVVNVIVSTAKMGRFFRAIDGASPEQFLRTAERYGYWNATPEENAEVGLSI
jgi:quercetin dioxygenase-like cupin family protein